MEYKVVTFTGDSFWSTMDGLERQVNEYIAQGWKPLGSLGLLTHTREGDWYKAFQAMVKENDDDG